MRYQHQLKTTLLIATVISLAFTIFFSYLQVKSPAATCYSIYNNIIICILTGCTITLIQAFIGYGNAKREAVLKFYKNTLILEKMIYDHSVLGRGFSFAKKGYSEIIQISKYFNDELKLSYVQIYRENKKDSQIQAITIIFNIYHELYLKYQTMESTLGAAVNFIEMSNEEIKKAGLDEKAETQKYNSVLAEKMQNIIEELSDEKKRKSLNENNKIIELYLFGKRRVKLSEV